MSQDPQDTNDLRHRLQKTKVRPLTQEVGYLGAYVTATLGGEATATPEEIVQKVRDASAKAGVLDEDGKIDTYLFRQKAYALRSDTPGGKLIKRYVGGGGKNTFSIAGLNHLSAALTPLLQWDTDRPGATLEISVRMLDALAVLGSMTDVSKAPSGLGTLAIAPLAAIPQQEEISMQPEHNASSSASGYGKISETEAIDIIRKALLAPSLQRALAEAIKTREAIVEKAAANGEDVKGEVPLRQLRQLHTVSTSDPENIIVAVGRALRLAGVTHAALAEPMEQALEGSEWTKEKILKALLAVLPTSSDQSPQPPRLERDFFVALGEAVQVASIARARELSSAPIQSINQYVRVETDRAFQSVTEPWDGLEHEDKLNALLILSVYRTFPRSSDVKSTLMRAGRLLSGTRSLGTVDNPWKEDIADAMLEHALDELPVGLRSKQSIVGKLKDIIESTNDGPPVVAPESFFTALGKGLASDEIYQRLLSQYESRDIPNDRRTAALRRAGDTVELPTEPRFSIMEEEAVVMEGKPATNGVHKLAPSPGPSNQSPSPFFHSAFAAAAAGDSALGGGNVTVIGGDEGTPATAPTYQPEIAAGAAALTPLTFGEVHITPLARTFLNPRQAGGTYRTFSTTAASPTDGEAIESDTESLPVGYSPEVKYKIQVGDRNSSTQTFPSEAAANEFMSQAVGAIVGSQNAPPAEVLNRINEVAEQVRAKRSRS